jgi:hypothetical protein
MYKTSHKKMPVAEHLVVAVCQTGPSLIQRAAVQVCVTASRLILRIKEVYLPL